jgi:hypothetical protein
VPVDRPEYETIELRVWSASIRSQNPSTKPHQETWRFLESFPHHVSIAGDYILYVEGDEDELRNGTPVALGEIRLFNWKVQQVAQLVQGFYGPPPQNTTFESMLNRYGLISLPKVST